MRQLVVLLVFRWFSSASNCSQKISLTREVMRGTVRLTTQKITKMAHAFAPYRYTAFFGARMPVASMEKPTFTVRVIDLQNVL